MCKANSFQQIEYHTQFTKGNKLTPNLLPKDSAAGTKFNLFVMVSDWQQDSFDKESDWRFSRI